MCPAEGSEVQRRGAAAAEVVRGTEGPVKQWWSRGKRTRVVQRGEGKRSSGGRRGPWSRGMGADAAGCNVVTATCG